MLIPTPKNCSPSVKKAIQLLSSKLDYDVQRTLANITLTDLTASSLVGTNASKLLESVTIGTGLDYTRPTLSLSHLGIESLTNAGADKVLFWDDSTTACGWLDVGNSIAITTTTLDTIQDIRTTATPEFTGLTSTGTIDASAGKVRIRDDAASKPSSQSDGYISVYKNGATKRLYTFVGGQRYYINLTADAEVTPGVGNSIGLLLVLTYAA